MNILLINPPRHNEIVADNPAFIDEERGYNPPLGLLYLASYVKSKSNHNIKVIDAQVEEYKYDNEFAKAILETNPDVVGLTAMTFTLVDVVKTIHLVSWAAEQLNKKITIVLGGPHATVFPNETAELPDVDYVIVGEGEVAFLELLNALDRGSDISKIKGLVYENSGQIINNGRSDFIEDLDQLPIPAREMLPVKKYNSILSSDRIVTTMFTSRGCPFQCSFCDRPHLGKRFRSRSAKNVVDEISACLKLGIGEILIYDDTFTVDRQRTIDICNEIIKRKLIFLWDIRARVDTIDEEVLSKLKQAGCQRIHFGVEAGTEKILKVLKKGVTLSQIEKAFKLSREMGMETLAYFMIGAPSETKEDVYASLKFAKKIKPNYTHITIFTPYPATEIYRQALDKGIIKNDIWREFARNPKQGIITRYWEEDFTRQELFDLLDKFYRSFYGRPTYILSSLLKIKSFNDLKKKIKIGLKILKI
jgi:anaerobic magnesium-protoporphyrin IX monomethyl ester cyclase